MKNSILWLLFGTSMGYLIIYTAYLSIGGNHIYSEEILGIAAGTACTLYIILFLLANCRRKKEPLYILFGRIALNAIWLNYYNDVDVFLCIQGNTDCICLTVEENRSVVYTNKTFLTNRTNIRGMLRDLQVMRRYRQRKGEIPDVCNEG